MPRITHTTNLDAMDEVLTATAPYNFVSFPTKFRPDDQLDLEGAGHDVYASDRLSGYIDLTITALTELFVRGTLTPSEYTRLNEAGRPTPQPEFFNPANVGRIPGSTLRGLTRNLLEIMSESRVQDVTDETLFFRTMDGSALAKAYTDIMVTRAHGAFGSAVSAGYIAKIKGKYVIYPAELKNGAQFFRIEDRHVSFSKPKEWERVPVWFIPQAPAMDTTHHVPFWHGKISGADCIVQDPALNGKDRPSGSGWEIGCLVVSGDVPKKSMHWIIGPPASRSKDVPAGVIADYERGGLTKDVKAAGFSILPTGNEQIPCFYKEHKGAVTAIGHTGMFRLPHVNTPASLMADLILDGGAGLAEGIFGVSGAESAPHAGFVCFEDAFLTDQNKLDKVAKQPRILGEPHPTTFPHYVCQDEVGRQRDREGRLTERLNTKALKHWDSDKATPRGSKMYWHRRASAPERQRSVWQEDSDVSVTDSHSTPIKVATDGAVFCGRVRFHNLTNVQLGALLAALQLPGPTHAHKLGMGKPYGLGSVRLRLELNLIDRANRYRSLFASEETEEGWHTGSAPANDRIESLKLAFAEWMGAASTVDFWKSRRMQELEVMLRFENGPSPRMTEYLQGPGPAENGPNEFSKRRVLPGPLQVAGEPDRPDPLVRQPTESSSSTPRTSHPRQNARPSQPEPLPPPTVAKTPPESAASPDNMREQTSYAIGQKILVTVIEKQGNLGTVELETGERLPGQNVGQCQVGQKVKLWVKEVVEGKVAELTRDRSHAVG